MQTISIPLSGNFQQVTTVSDNNFFKSLVAFGYSGFTTGIPLNNAGTAYIGYSTGALPFTVSAGSYAAIDIPNTNASSRDNLANLWVKGTSGDGLFLVVY